MRGDGFDIPFTMGAYDKFTDFLYDMWYRSPVCWKILKYQSHFLVYCPSENLITVRNEVAKVMFLHLSVILFTGGLLQCMLGYHPPGTDTPLEETPPWTTPPLDQVPPDQTPPDQAPPRPGTPPGPGASPGPDTPHQTSPQKQTHPPADGYCCGRYASYWNAYLFSIGDNCKTFVSIF